MTQLDPFQRSTMKLALGHMTDKVLAEYEQNMMGWEATNPDEQEAKQEVIDLIRDEQAGRKHDLEDPSSGLGVGPS